MSDTDAVTADDLRALSAAALDHALMLTPCECADETGYIRQHEVTCPHEWIRPLRNHADALADLIDAARALHDGHATASRWTALADALAALDADT